LFPCEGEVITYTITSENVDVFSWFFPPGWQVFGNANNDTVQVIAGSNSGVLTVYGSNPCGNSSQIVNSAGPDLLPSVFNIVGNLTPCAGDVVTYSSITLEVDSFHWQFPTGWQLLSDPNEPVVEVIAGTESGLITITGSNFCGTEQLSFDADPFTAPNVSIILNSPTLLSLSESGIQYQWFHNGTAIPGATNSTYQVEEDGLYYAMITFIGGCSTVSNEVFITITSVISPPALALDVYPIPAKDKLFLKGLEGEFEYSVFSITGQKLLEDIGGENVVPVHRLTKGIYLLQVWHNDKRYQGKFTIQ